MRRLIIVGAFSAVRVWLLLVLLHLLVLREAIATEKSDVSRIELWIENRQVKGDLNESSSQSVSLTKVAVRQDDWVEIYWHTDETVSLHLHGYDIEQVIKAGGTAMMQFRAHATGRFQITAHRFGEPSTEEDHGSGHHTALLYFEVHPH